MCQTIRTVPSDTDNAPCLKAFVVSSWIAIPRDKAALGFSRTFGPSKTTFEWPGEKNGCSSSRSNAFSVTFCHPSWLSSEYADGQRVEAAHVALLEFLQRI